MPGCDNNCEAVADLYESSVNAIAYSKLFNAWLNGAQNATVNIGGVSTPTLRNLAMSIKQLVGVWPDNLTIKIDQNKKIYVVLKPGGGLKVDANGAGLYVDSSDFIQLGGGLARDPNTGAIYVDFEQMPITKFETILESFRKGLRLPKWLDANLNIFVDNTHPNASNSLSEGRGLTADKPFATPQAAVNYVTDNYNLTTHNIHIYVKAGTTYEGAPLVLPEYQTNTGQIIITSWTGTGTDESNTRFKIKRTTPVSGSSVQNGALCCRGGVWNVYNCDAESDVSDFTNVYREVAGIVCGNGGTLYLRGFAARCKFTDASKINASAASSITARPIYCLANSIITMEPGTIANEIEFTKNSAITKSIYNNAIVSAGTVNIHGSSYTGRDGNLYVKANAINIFAQATLGGSIVVSHSGAVIPNMEIKMASGYTATGQKYQCTSGGSINVGGLGPDYFPGATAGTVDADTYSWYK